MGEKFLQFLPLSSKLGRVIRQVAASATPKSRKARKTPEERQGKAGTARGAKQRPARSTTKGRRPTQATRSPTDPSGTPLPGPAPDRSPAPGGRPEFRTFSSHTRKHGRKKQTPAQRAVSMKNLKKARAALKRLRG